MLIIFETSGTKSMETQIETGTMMSQKIGSGFSDMIDDPPYLLHESFDRSFDQSVN